MKGLLLGLSALAVASVLTSSTAQAAVTFTIAEVNGAAKLATDLFSTENPDHVEHFVGYKIWKATDQLKVKVYVDHDGMPMEFNYFCHHHEDGDLECHDL